MTIKLIDDTANIEIVYFYATWCGPCKLMSKTLAELLQLYPDRCVVTKYDVDEHPALATKHKITKLPTLLLYVDGCLSKRFDKLVSLDKLVKAVKSQTTIKMIID